MPTESKALPLQWWRAGRFACVLRLRRPGCSSCRWGACDDGSRAGHAIKVGSSAAAAPAHRAWRLR